MNSHWQRHGRVFLLEQTEKCLRHTWGTKAGKITLRALPFKRRDAEAIAANMSKAPDVERGSLAAYGRIIVAFKGGLQIDLETP